MAIISLAIVTVLYIFTAIGFFRSGKHGLALAYVAYAIANVGLIIEGMK